MMSDPIADMLTRIRNGLLARKGAVLVPFSKFKLQLANILLEEGYVAAVRDASVAGKPMIEIELSYNPDGAPVIRSISRVSKPSQRIYRAHDALPRILNGQGISVVSTPAGLLTNREAKKRGVGGEVICEVY